MHSSDLTPAVSYMDMHVLVVYLFKRVVTTVAERFRSFHKDVLKPSLSGLVEVKSAAGHFIYMLARNNAACEHSDHKTNKHIQYHCAP